MTKREMMICLKAAHMAVYDEIPIPPELWRKLGDMTLVQLATLGDQLELSEDITAALHIALSEKDIEIMKLSDDQATWLHVGCDVWMHRSIPSEAKGKIEWLETNAQRALIASGDLEAPEVP